MKRVPAVVVSVAAGVASLFLLGTTVADEQKDAAPGGWSLYVPGEIAWKAGPESLAPGSKVAVLEGDPAKDGFFTIACFCPTGTGSPRTGIRRSSD